MPDWRRLIIGDAFALQSRDPNFFRGRFLFFPFLLSTIMAVTANQMRGSNNSAFAADQNIRGVQTFRDPTTGKTMELSNLYDHAWLNGSNEYIMSEDPNFNPNGQLTGQWNQLQAVRPAP